MKLSIEEIEQIAILAQLELTEEEKQMYADQLSAVLDYMETLNEVETDNVEETCQVTGLEDVVREDKVFDCDEETRKKLLACFPDKKGNLLKVQAVWDTTINN